MRLLLALGPSAGGIGRHVRDLADHFSEVGWDVTVAGPDQLKDCQRTGPTALPIARWMSGYQGQFVPVEVPGRLQSVPAAARKLRPLLARCDVVHAHGLKAGLVSARTARLVGVPSVVTVHNLAHLYWRARAVRVPPIGERIVGHLADVAIGASVDIAAALGRSARMIPVAAELPSPRRPVEVVRNQLGLPAEDIFCLCVARLHAQKRLEDLVRAAAFLPDGVRLFVAGDGPLRPALQALIDETGVSVELLGHRDDISDLVHACDIAVLPSAWEAIPLFLKEAAAAAKPLVGTDAGGTSMIVEPGKTGMLVPVRQPGALADAIQSLAADSELRRRLGAGARDLVTTRFSAACMFEQLAGVYREVCRGA